MQGERAKKSRAQSPANNEDWKRERESVFVVFFGLTALDPQGEDGQGDNGAAHDENLEVSCGDHGVPPSFQSM